MRRLGICLVVVTALYWLCGRLIAGDSRLVRTTVARTPGNQELDVRRVHGVDLTGLDALVDTPGGITVTWHGVWEVPVSGLYDIAIDGNGEASWTIDGHLAQTTSSEQRVSRTIELDAGFHDIDLRYEPESTPRLTAMVARARTPLAALDAQRLKPRLPRHPVLRRVASVLHTGLGWLIVAGLAVAGRHLATRWRLARRYVDPHEPPRDANDAPSSVPAFKRWRNRLIASSILVLLVGYGAWLRLDAITAHYGPVTQPAWLAHLQTRALAADSWRPASFVWDPAPTFPHQDGVSTRYRSDPYTYIQYAREMRTFYWAHYREPVFPFVTKVALQLLANQDVAVSFASAFFSALAIVTTYLLGASLGSRLVGLLAACAFAIDYDFVSLASEGWRDDAYIAAVGLTVWMLLRLWRQTSGVERRIRLGPWPIDVAYGTAVAFGVVAGLTILVRLMAASFIFPVLGVLIFAMRRPWRARVAIVAVALLATIVTAGPYFFSCWRVYGDPLYSFNVHGHFYRLAEGMADSESGTASYVTTKFRSHPFDMADTVLRGLTVYPFTNKWFGLERWHDSLGTYVSIAALAGIPILAATPPGRWVLFVLLMSVVPFAFTWKVDPNLRFTAFTYPLYLIAAATTAVSACRLVYLLFTDPDRARRRTPIRRSTILAVVSLGVAILAMTWVVVHLLPPRIDEERLRNGEETTVFAAHDATGAFFGPGWSAVTGTGNVQARVVARSADVFLRLPRAADYPLTMRLDPFPRPLNDSPAHLPRVELRLNGTPLATTLLQWTPERVGAYDIVLPHTATRAGKNVLTFLVRHAFDTTPLARPGLSEGDAVAVWYVRVHVPVAMQSE